MKRAHRKEENICKRSEQHGINLQNMQQLLQLNIKKKKKQISIHNQKIGGRPKYTFLQRRHTGGQEEHEKTLNIAKD